MNNDLPIFVYEYTLEELTKLAAASNSISDMLRALGRNPRSRATATRFKLYLVEQGIDLSHFSRAIPQKYTREVLAEAVSQSRSLAGVLRYLNLRQAGGTQAHISGLIRKFGISTSHFGQNGGGQGAGNRRRKSVAEILVRLPPNSTRAKTTQLRRALKESGVAERCELCGQGTVWNNIPLQLEVDHRDGDWCNNLLENLRFLCPNCHSQQTTSNRPHKFGTNSRTGKKLRRVGVDTHT